MGPFLMYPEAIADPKWRRVARTAGATPGEVLAVFLALCAHASTQRPRGAVDGFDAEETAEAFGWPPERVTGIVDALVPQVVQEGRLRGWDKRQHLKTDRTNAERQRRWRDRRRTPERKEVTPLHGVTVADSVTPSNGVTRGVTPVTPVTLGGDYRGGSFDPSLALEDQATLETPRAALRASVGDVWGWIERAGIPVHLGLRALKSGAVRGWADRGLTPQQFAEAVRRARSARERSGDPSPINLGFLSRFVDEVLAGRPERSTHASNSVERTDAAVESYLRGRGA